MEPEVTMEMIGAGMRKWDELHDKGIRDWPTMLEGVYLAMRQEKYGPKTFETSHAN